jgi:ATP-dependent exoDNAse (exonuclease V) beta subunit
MITKKYDYAELTRASVDGQRLYTCPDGNAVPSVTTILDKTKSKEKQQALANWRKSVGEEKATQIVTEAANRGTRMHTYLENYVLGEELKETVTNPYAQQSLDMAKIVIKEGLCNVDEYWGTEVALYHPRIYAGTTDLVGVHKGEPAILDFKQTNKPKKREWIEDYFLQLAAYAEAHNEVYGTNIRKGVVLMCSKDYKYQEFISEGTEWDMWRDLWWQRVEEYYVKHR